MVALVAPADTVRPAAVVAFPALLVLEHVCTFGHPSNMLETPTALARTRPAVALLCLALVVVGIGAATWPAGLDALAAWLLATLARLEVLWLDPGRAVVELAAGTS